MSQEIIGNLKITEFWSKLKKNNNIFIPNFVNVVFFSGVSFTPKEVGEHLVNVFKNGQHIPNSPFKITVSSAEIGDASKVRVWGPGTSKATTNEVARFNIDMSDAGQLKLNVADFVPDRFRPTSNFDRFRPIFNRFRPIFDRFRPTQISSHFRQISSHF